MRVISHPQQFNVDDLYIDLAGIFDYPLLLKCEGFNFAGSVKLKPAVAMIEAAEISGAVSPGMTLVESSSGNIGIALSMLAASRGYGFVCVTDLRCNPAAKKLMEAFGATVHIVSEPDGRTGLLGARIRYVQELCACNSDYVWLNQYANQANCMAHFETTARAISDHFPELDVLLVGAGTTGTLMGCARYFKAQRPSVCIVAVDSYGSVNFDGPAGRRMLPGIGTSLRPALLDETYIDDVVHVAEPDAVRACHTLLRRGFLFGGSTGTVISGAMSWLACNRMPRWYRPDICR